VRESSQRLYRGALFKDTLAKALMREELTIKHLNFVESSNAHVLLEVDQVLSVFVLHNDRFGEVRIPIKDAVHHGEGSALAQGNVHVIIGRNGCSQGGGSKSY
jgi:hypothetical protein